MTIENYFERRIRPIVEDNNKQRSGQNNDGQQYTSGQTTGQTTGHTGGYAAYTATHTGHTATNTAAHTTSHSAPYTSYTASHTASSHNSSGIIDEDQLNRTFQEIVNCINLDDDSEEGKAMTMFSSHAHNRNSSNSYNEMGGNFSRSSLNFNHVHHSLLPEFNSIFGGSKSSFNVAVGSGSGKGETAMPGTGTGSSPAANLGKSFLDDDWFPREYEQTSTATAATKSRPITPASTIISGNPPDYYHNNNFTANPPPNDYLCKLCNCDGHWMKDCRLYEPRTPPSSISSSSFKSSYSNSSSNGSNNSNNPSSNSNSSAAVRTLMPPGNYVCRLCNVSGHWIDQCSKFQPKHLLDSCSSNQSALAAASSAPVLPPMLGPGPTPNYRPPAYLSKPVPSNYICNLCNRPGHWIQQCSEFTPIITHKPRV